MAEIIQADLAKVDISVNIVSYEWAEYLKRSNAGEQEMILLGWTSDNADPDNILNLLLSCDGAKAGANKARWCNRDYDALMAKARTSSDVAERTQTLPACTGTIQGGGTLGHHEPFGGVHGGA